MKTYLAAVFLAVVAGCVAPEFHASTTVQASALPATPTGTVPAWNVPQEPLDATVITPVESAGASRAE